MIQVDDLTLIYNGETLFEEASFTINPKERCGFVGRNGSGKTSLLRLLVGQEVPDQGVVSLSKGYNLGYLDQHIRFSKPTVLEEASLGLPQEQQEDIYKAERILFGLGFKEGDLALSPQQMSGGYQLRLHLTKVLLSEPDCLLLDEPTNYLDILSMRFLMRFLKQWQGELILISHDRQFMDSVTTHTLGIHRNKVHKIKGDTNAFFEHLVQQEEIHERTRLNLEKKRTHLQSYIDRFGAKASKAAQAQSRQKMLEKLPALEQLKALYDLQFNFRERPFPGKKMVDIKNMEFAYTAEKPLIQNISMAIEQKEGIAIIGKNGFGKSTLLRLIAQELVPDQGEVCVSEQVAIGYFGQTNIQRLKDNETIESEIAAANPALNTTDIRAICGQMMFSGDKAKKKISVLSGGEKSRVLLGKILAKPCNLLLLDEPTHHLDIESIEALITAIGEFKGAFVIVTHSELILKRLNFHKLIICHQEKQDVFFGQYEEFLEKVGWEEENSAKQIQPNVIDRQERKKKHEELMNARAQIKVLENQLRKVEKAIGELEVLQSKESSLILDASNEGQMDRLQELMRSSANREREIEILYQNYLAIETELIALKKNMIAI